MSAAGDKVLAQMAANMELRKKMTERFGSFGAEVLELCLIREETEKVTDEELGHWFDIHTRVHRKCFNKKAFIASCREPI
jgi:hypothetical protein